MMTTRLTLHLCFLLAAGPLAAQTTNAAAAKAPATNAPAAVAPAVAPIALADVVTQAQAVGTSLTQEKAGLSPDPVAQPIIDALPDMTKQIDRRLNDDQQLLAANYSLLSLQNSLSAWDTLGGSLNDDAKALAARAAQLASLAAQLDQQKAQWQATQATAGKAPSEITGRISGVLAAVGDTAKAVLAAQNQLFAAQAQVAAQVERVQDASKAVQREMNTARAKLFEQTRPALWNAEALAPPQDGGMVSRERLTFSEQVAAVKAYLHEKAGAVLVHLFLFAILIATFHWIRQKTSEKAKSEEALREAERIFNMPVATALLVALLASRWLYPMDPRLLHALISSVALVPAVVIVRRLIQPALYPLLYATVLAYFIDLVRFVATPSGVFARFVLLAELVAACLFILVILRTKSLSASGPNPPLQERLVRVYLHSAFFVFLAGGFANVFGYTMLSFQLGDAMLASSYFAVLFYAAVRICDALAIAAMSLRPLNRLGMVRRHRDLVYDHVAGVIRWIAFALWLVFALEYFGVRDPIWQHIVTFLTREHQFGTFHDVQLGPIVAFPFVVWASFALSRVIRFAMEEDLYPQLSLPRGIPYAISTMVHYSILVIGFLMGLSAMGINLGNYAILAGAFGVGLGFGLQNIMNNFMSGLILLFERPIKVGDTIQLDATTIGKVERIGIRASIILLTNGAEVIVPNGNLISNPVTNWTLSNCERLLEIPISVSPKVNLQQALDVLTHAAASHPDVLKNPPPQAVLVSLGATSVALKVRCWVDAEEDWMKITTQLGISTIQALERENIPMA